MQVPSSGKQTKAAWMILFGKLIMFCPHEEQKISNRLLKFDVISIDPLIVKI